MSQDTDLKTAIETRLFAVSGFPDAEHRAIEDETFEPPDASTVWSVVYHRFGTEQLMTVPAAGGQLWKYGFTQVDLNAPPEGGRGALDTLADAVRAAFPARLRLPVGARGLETRVSQRAGISRRGAWLWDHIDIYWVLRAVNPL